MFDKFDMNYPTVFVTGVVQKSAVQFVKDMRSVFGEDALWLYARNYELSRPFEYYLHFSRSFDRNIFGDLEFEDDLGEGHTVSGMDFWDRSLARIHADVPADYKEPLFPSKVRRKNKLMRALYLFVYDRDTFFKKLKTKFKIK